MCCTIICRVLSHETTEMVLQNTRFNAVGVVRFRRNPIFIHAYVEIHHVMI